MFADACDYRSGPCTLKIAAGFRLRLDVIPYLLTCPLIDSPKQLTAAWPAPENHQVTVEDWRRRVSPDMVELADVVLPNQIARHVVTKQPGRAVTDDDSLTIGDRRCRAEGIRAMCRFRHFVDGVALPKQVARGSIETQ